MFVLFHHDYSDSNGLSVSESITTNWDIEMEKVKYNKKPKQTKPKQNKSKPTNQNIELNATLEIDYI